MKLYIKRLIAIVLLFVIPLSICLFTQNYWDSDSSRLVGFYQEDEESLDVVLLGASEVYNAYSPAIAYKEYGFTSYPFALGLNNLYLFENQINEVLEHQNPSLIIIDLNAAISLDQSWNDRINDKESNEFDIVIRRYTENMPFSRNKVEVISQYGLKEDFLSYYFPFIVHHGEWNCIQATIEKTSQNRRGYTYLKGIHSSNHKIDQAELYPIKNNNEKTPIFSDDDEELRKLLEYCRENVNCKVIFTKIPHRIVNEDKYKRFKMGNYLGDIVAEYGFDYFNFDHEIDNIGLDINKDFADNGHLNAYGQQKFTRFLGEIIHSRYVDDPIQQSTNNKKKWETAVSYTVEFYRYYSEQTTEVDLYETKDLIEILSKRIVE